LALPLPVPRADFIQARDSTRSMGTMVSRARRSRRPVRSACLYVAPCTIVVLYIVRTTGSYACMLRNVRLRSGRQRRKR
jgi:hypothetical protein